MTSTSPQTKSVLVFLYNDRIDLNIQETAATSGQK